MKFVPSEKQRLLSEEGILCSWRYRVLLHKHYFSTGQALLSEWKIQYLILGGIIAEGLNAGIWGISLFVLVSYIIGRIWFKRIRGACLKEIDAEVGNQFNKFQQEMRQTYKKQ